MVGLLGRGVLLKQVEHPFSVCYTSVKPHPGFALIQVAGTVASLLSMVSICALWGVAAITGSKSASLCGMCLRMDCLGPHKPKFCAISFLGQLHITWEYLDWETSLTFLNSHLWNQYSVGISNLSTDCFESWSVCLLPHHLQIWTYSIFLHLILIQSHTVSKARTF